MRNSKNSLSKLVLAALLAGGLAVEIGAAPLVVTEPIPGDVATSFLAKSSDMGEVHTDPSEKSPASSLKLGSQYHYDKMETITHQPAVIEITCDQTDLEGSMPGEPQRHKRFHLKKGSRLEASDDRGEARCFGRVQGEIIDMPCLWSSLISARSYPESKCYWPVSPADGNEEWYHVVDPKGVDVGWRRIN